MAEKYLLTSTFEEIRRGQEFEGQLPPHVTLVGWFEVPHPRALENRVQNYAARLSPVEVTGEGEALFGPEEDVRVRLVTARLGRLSVVHAQLLDAVTRTGGQVLRPEWSGEGYRPHVTFVDGVGLGEGESQILSRIELIEQRNNSDAKTVLASLPLSQR